jgi:drug/metabolite transporter (DMT)-like permease
MAAGIVTALAGLLFIVNPETHFFPTVWPIIGWLLVRSLILAGSLTEIEGTVRRWTAISAGLDFLLAVLLIAGLSASTLVVSVFGPTPELIAGFAWVLAASFVINGLMLLEVASCELDLAA